MTNLKIIFLGTSEFAVPTLEILLKNNFNIQAVVTNPDKRAGRGLKLRPCAVKVAAEKHKLPILQPTNFLDKNFLNNLKKYNADIQVVVAFKILPIEVWNMPKLGTINLHASLLPQYRGAAPINWSIINGENVTGVTTFFLDKNVDTGNIAMAEKEPIYPNDSAGELYNRLKLKGANLVLKTLNSIIDGTSNKIDQAELVGAILKKAPKITKVNSKINWNDSFLQVKNFVRGLSPFPGAWTEINGQKYKIFEVQESKNIGKPLLPGILSTDQKKYIDIGTLDKPVSIIKLQAEGRKKMTVVEFLSGNNI